jgi:hypothetical protein
MTPQQMLLAAGSAVSETRKLLPNGNANPVDGLPGTAMRSNDPNQQARIGEKVDEAYKEKFARTDSLGLVLCQAKIAMGVKAGNCDHFASVAFAWLFINGYFPISRAYYPGHAFVIIGDPGGQHVICDPWANQYLRGPSTAYPNPQVNSGIPIGRFSCRIQRHNKGPAGERWDGLFRLTYLDLCV